MGISPDVVDEETETAEVKGLAQGYKAISWKKQDSTAVRIPSQYIPWNLNLMFL